METTKEVPIPKAPQVDKWVNAGAEAKKGKPDLDTRRPYTILFDDEMYVPLRREAFERGVKISTIIREAVLEWMANHPR